MAMLHVLDSSGWSHCRAPPPSPLLPCAWQTNESRVHEPPGALVRSLPRRKEMRIPPRALDVDFVLPSVPFHQSPPCFSTRERFSFGRNGGQQHSAIRSWQRWKPRRKTASLCSGLVRGPALVEGERLETRGQMGLANQPPSRAVLLRSARCEGGRTELTPVQHSTRGAPATQSPGLARQNGGLVAANLARGSALCGEAQ